MHDLHRKHKQTDHVHGKKIDAKVKRTADIKERQMNNAVLTEIF